MNELNKLIEQFAKEEDTPAFMIHALIREVEDEKGTWLNKLLDWLASRPTCGVEQRKFLDEVENDEYYIDERNNIRHKKTGLVAHGVDFEGICDLQKVIKGE
jgi:hypothetical protein